MRVSEHRLKELHKKASAEEPSFGDVPDVDEVLSMCEEILAMRKGLREIQELLRDMLGIGK